MTAQKVVVHEFIVTDPDDPDLHAGEPLYQWEKSDAGKWIMEHAKDAPTWHRHLQHDIFGYQYRVVAKLDAADYTYYCLKWK